MSGCRPCLSSLQQKSEVNIAHWAGLVPANADSPAVLRALISQGAVGFKGFMCPSGINDFAHVTGPDIAAALPVLKRAGVTLMLHAEVVSDVPEPTVRTVACHIATPCLVH